MFAFENYLCSEPHFRGTVLQKKKKYPKFVKQDLLTSRRNIVADFFLLFFFLLRTSSVMSFHDVESRGRPSEFEVKLGGHSDAGSSQ